MKTVVTFIIFITTVIGILIILPTPQVFAGNCPSSGTPVPTNQQLGSPGNLHTFTGRDCSAIRPKPGNLMGPGQYGDPSGYECLGACTYKVNYCTSDGSDSCEATYPQKDCPTAPAPCNNPNTAPQSDISKIFGQILPPPAIQNFGYGSAGINQFLSNGVTLFYSLAAIVLIFMFLWAAFEWMTSGGEKEKVASARNKIIYAIIGIILFAVAFAVIRMLGQFTGFTFFEGQNFTVRRNASGQIISVDCRNGRTLSGSFENRDYASDCNK